MGKNDKKNDKKDKKEEKEKDKKDEKKRAKKDVKKEKPPKKPPENSQPPIEIEQEEDIHAEIEKIKEKVREEEQFQQVQEEVKEDIEKPILIKVKLENGEIKEYDAKKDKEFCVYCINPNCRAYKDNLSYEMAARLRNALEHYRCTCNSNKFAIKTNEFVTICKDLGIKIKPFHPELIEIIFKKVILKQLDIVDVELK